MTGITKLAGIKLSHLSVQEKNCIKDLPLLNASKKATGLFSSIINYFVRWKQNSAIRDSLGCGKELIPLEKYKTFVDRLNTANSDGIKSKEIETLKLSFNSRIKDIIAQRKNFGEGLENREIVRVLSDLIPKNETE